MNTSSTLPWYTGLEPRVYGIDWLTVTTKKENAGTFDAARTIWCQKEELLTEIDGKEGTLRDFVGHKWGKLFIGSNKTHTIFQISSHVPWEVFVDVVGRHGVSFTRIDLQVTYDSHRTKGATGRLFFDYLAELAATGVLDERLTPEKREKLTDVETVYVGAPTSDRRLRLYNKTVQEKTFDDAVTRWRLEVQFRHEVAHQAAMVLGAYWNGAGMCNVPELVMGQLKSWNIEAPRGYEGMEVAVAIPAAVKDMQKKFTWITTQCVPTLRRLLDDERLGAATEELLLHLLSQRLS